MAPALIHYRTPAEYEAHFVREYCNARIVTFDGIRVYFPRGFFHHAFFESANRRAQDKLIFARQRAERIDWIRAALANAKADLFVGWDNRTKREDPSRRVALAYGNYVVVIMLQGTRKAAFITAFLAGPTALPLIAGSRRWPL